MRCRFIAFFTLTLYFTGTVLAGIVTDNVTSVLDGDTIVSWLIIYGIV
jgi:hypothetical protein